jgi:hypothetical protein
MAWPVSIGGPDHTDLTYGTILTVDQLRFSQQEPDL